jgi:hypothetical protein
MSMHIYLIYISRPLLSVINAGNKYLVSVPLEEVYYVMPWKKKKQTQKQQKQKTKKGKGRGSKRIVEEEEEEERGEGDQEEEAKKPLGEVSTSAPPRHTG